MHFLMVAEQVIMSTEAGKRVSWGWRWVKGVIYFHSVSKEFNSSSNRTDLPNTLPAPPWQAKKKKLQERIPLALQLFLEI